MEDVLRYLGIKGELTEELKEDISLMQNKARSLQPTHVSAYFSIIQHNNGCYLQGTDINLCGNLAKKQFSSCRGVVVVLATLTLKSELLLKQVFAVSPSKAVILDAVLTDQLEKYLDGIEEELKVTYGDIKGRISCGYGDLDISMQKALYVLLDGQRIGVKLHDSFMLTPNKSVIALIGVV